LLIFISSFYDDYVLVRHNENDRGAP